MRPTLILSFGDEPNIPADTEGARPRPAAVNAVFLKNNRRVVIMYEN
jgi:hypothetical protein